MAIIEDNSYGPGSAKFFQDLLGKGGFVPHREYFTGVMNDIDIRVVDPICDEVLRLCSEAQAEPD